MMEPRKTITVELEDFLTAFSPDVRNIALALRDLIFEVEPRAKEQLDFRTHVMGYGYAETYKHSICVLILFDDFVNLGFPRGVELADPEGLLQGEGESARHVRITEVAQVESAEVVGLIQAAVDATPTTNEK